MIDITLWAFSILPTQHSMKENPCTTGIYTHPLLYRFLPLDNMWGALSHADVYFFFRFVITVIINFSLSILLLLAPVQFLATAPTTAAKECECWFLEYPSLANLGRIHCRKVAANKKREIP